MTKKKGNHRKRVKFTCFGETKTLGEWSKDKRCKVCYDTLRTRIRKGWDIEKSLTENRNNKGKGRGGGKGKALEKKYQRQNTSEAQQQFIKQNCLTMSDAEIAKKLNVAVSTVTNIRYRMGIKKGYDGKALLGDQSVLKITPLDEVLKDHRIFETPEQRQAFFREQLRNSGYYRIVMDSFTPEEVVFYLEEWVTLCEQFVDVLHTERRQIHEYITLSILENRTLKQLKEIEDAYSFFVRQGRDLEKRADFNDDMALEEHRQAIIEAGTRAAEHCNGINKVFSDLVVKKHKALEALNGRRKDRIENIKSAAVDFTSLVEAFTEKETRQVQGEFNELLNAAKEKTMNQWRQKNEFPDGTRDYYLMDNKTDA